MKVVKSANSDAVPLWVSFTAGAIAGISEISLMYPLDVVKTRFQISTGKEYSGMADCLVRIVKNEGFSRLYRGIVPPIIMEAPKRATKFAANDAFGKLYMRLFNTDRITQGLSVLTGASAGAVESLVVVPFELVKIRLQDQSSATKYSGTLDSVKKIVTQEGLLALYNGLEATMWRHVLWNSGYFGCIHSIKALLPAGESKSEKLWNNFLAGSIGGTIGTALNTPFDVVKSRIQNTPRISGKKLKYNWALPSLATIAREEGFAALYKGFMPKVIRLGPGGGILLVVFDQVISFYKKLALS